MYQRLLAFLSLAFYSYSNQLINNNENAEAGYFVTLYKMVDPSNSEAWYFSAILHARDRDAKSAEEDLLKAVGYGFRDESRMRLQPEFQNLSLQMNFPRIENAMHVPLKVNGTWLSAMQLVLSPKEQVIKRRIFIVDLSNPSGYHENHGMFDLEKYFQIRLTHIIENY